jgi:hypothetical protein
MIQNRVTKGLTNEIRTTVIDIFFLEVTKRHYCTDSNVRQVVRYNYVLLRNIG